MSDTATPTLETHSRAVALPGPVTVQSDGRTVDVLITRWDTPEQVTDDGHTWYSEEFARGGLIVAPGARVVVRDEHDPAERPGVTTAPGVAPGRHGVVVGVVTETHVRSDGLYGTIRLVDNDDGQRVRGLIPDVLDSLSIEFDDVYRPIRAGDRVIRSQARLTGLVFTLNPQRGDARVLNIRSQPQETQPMSDTPTEAPAPAPAPEPAPATPPAAVAVAPQPQLVPQQRSAPQPHSHPVIVDGADIGFLNQFRSLGEFCQSIARTARRDDDEGFERHMRALHAGVELSETISSHRRAFEQAALADIAGLLPVQWLSEVIDLHRTLSPTLNNWTSSPLPDSGMTISQPIVGDRPLVEVEASEYGEPASNKLTVTSVSWTVGIYAGGQEMSIQVVQRSTPDYVTTLMRLYVAEMARSFNAAAATALYAAADDVNGFVEYVDAPTFPDLVVDASALFLGALGRPAEVAALSITLWKELGKAKEGNSSGRYLFPDIGAMNTVGSFNAQTPEGEVRRINYYVEPAWGTTLIKGVIGVRDAFKIFPGSMQMLSADAPASLSRSVAVYQFGAFGKTDAAGLQAIGNNT